MARLMKVVAASLLAQAALAVFPVPYPQPQAPPVPQPICMPNQWVAGYTRASDFAAAEGTLTHNYAEEIFALNETSFGKGYNGQFQFYHLHYYQQVNQSWAGITWADGTTHCITSNAATKVVLKQCLEHKGKHGTINEWPAQSAYNVFPNKKMPGHFVTDLMFLSRGMNVYPLQTFSWVEGKNRHPNFFLLNNNTNQFDSGIAQMPVQCSKGAEEGPMADAAIKILAQRAALQAEEGEFLPELASVSTEAAARLISQLKHRGDGKERDSSVCVPSTYTSSFYYMNDNYTVGGKLTHRFKSGDFGISENVTGPSLNIRARFVQMGRQGWAITESLNGTVLSCSTAPVQRAYDNPCRMVHSRRAISVNHLPAYHNDMYDPAGTGSGPTYTAFYQAQRSGLPIGILNFTNADVGRNGNPAVISFYDAYLQLDKKLMEVPASCKAGAEAQAEVQAQSEKWASHLINSI